MPIYIRTLGYKIYIWSNDFENEGEEVRFTHRF